MERLGECWRKVRALLLRRRMDRELEEEMRFHLEMKAARNRDDGLPERAARLAALRQFGNPALLKEDSRAAWGWGAAERLVQDARHAVRMLLRNPGFTAVALATLAIGIGATTVIYSVVHAVLLAPLPYREPDRLVVVYGSKPGWNPFAQLSAPNASGISAQSTVFDGLAMAGYNSVDLTGPGEPEHIEGSRATANLFSVLGVQPAAGRTFAETDFAPGAEPVVVLSHRLAERRFGGDAAAVGRHIDFANASRTVIGVMPPWFQYPRETTRYWVPLAPGRDTQSRAFTVFSTVGRLKPGIALERARAEVATIGGRLARAWPKENAGWKWSVAPMMDTVVGARTRATLLVLFGAVAMVLMVACANVANLLLARGAERHQEMAIRAALGSGRSRLVRLLFVESLALAAAGGGLGTLLAVWGVRVLAPLYPDSLPRTTGIRLDGPVLAFTVAVSFGAAILAGLLPALRISRADLDTVLRSGGRRAGWRTGRSRRALVISQVAAAMVLLTCAGLLVKSFLLRTRVGGFDPGHVLALDLTELPSSDAAPLLDRLRGIPGVTAAAATTSFTYFPAMGFQVEPPGQPGAKRIVMFDAVTPDFFRVMAIPLRRGRSVAETDTQAAPRVVVINEAMARQFFPGDDPLGKQIAMGKMVRTVIGVVGDVTFDAPDAQAQPAMYLPYRQWSSEPNIIAVRTSVPPAAVAGAVRGVVRAAEPHTPFLRIETLDQNLSRIVAAERFYTLMLGLFAAIALGLAALGVYGVVSFAVSLRTHEIGVRVALGASGRDVLASVMREGAVLAGSGTAIGIAASLAAARLLTGTSLLYRVRPHDPLTFALTPGVLLIVALAACWVPARRAAAVDPAVALRYE